MLEQQVNNLIGHLFRHEAGKMASVLTRLLGFNSLELAEDIVQDTLLQAMSTWKFKGFRRILLHGFTPLRSEKRLMPSGNKKFMSSIIPKSVWP